MSTHSTAAAAITSPAGDALPRAATLAFGVVAYIAFLGTFVYLVGFVGNWLVPKSIDSGRGGGLAGSIAVNAGLLLLFGLQHSIMARPWFKRAWTRVVPKSIERSCYVLATCLVLALAVWQWRPLPQEIWRVTHPAARVAIDALSLLGWTIVLVKSFAINHFDLFGLRQVWLRWSGRAYTPVGFRLVGLYRFVRHPLMLGFLIAFWAAPVMTIGRLVFALLVTGYVLVGTRLEERDLAAEHGEGYLAYRRTVPGLIPLPRRRGA